LLNPFGSRRAMVESAMTNPEVSILLSCIKIRYDCFVSAHSGGPCRPHAWSRC
jgi:hypothetical protein